MAKKFKKITQKEAHMLMDELGELLVSIRSWGFHYSHFVGRDADTGEILPDHNPIDRVSNLVIGIRTRIGQIK